MAVAGVDADAVLRRQQAHLAKLRRDCHQLRQVVADPLEDAGLAVGGEVAQPGCLALPALPKGGAADGPAIRRLPAGEIEAAVVAHRATAAGTDGAVSGRMGPAAAQQASASVSQPKPPNLEG
jgi:hypothetical protein